MGISALGLTMLSLLLIIANVLAGPFFMLWQGLLGVWLIVVNRLVSGDISRSVRWLGMVVGVGALPFFPSGTFSSLTRLSARFPSMGSPRAGTERANDILHNFLAVGGFIGVAPLPIWTALVGSRLLKMGRLDTAGVTTDGAV